MNKYIVSAVFLLLGICGYAQDFKSDNISYKTISWIDFFNKLEHNPKLTYFDIRSAGERNDNGQSQAFNQGKIRGAIETDFANFNKYYPEYLKHKNDTIYLYCSHSKRSRVLAKQLADSGFVNLVNINGGLSYFNILSDTEMPYKNKYYTNNLKYKLVTPSNFIRALNNEEFQVIDIRPDSLYLGKASDERQNSFGKIKSALHIPYDKLKDNLMVLDKTKSIYLFDNDGNQSPGAANYLIEQGYDTNVLIFGLSNVISTTEIKERNFLKTKYQFILPEELLKIVNRNGNTVIIDIRSEAEFRGTDKAAWKNIGTIKNAINIPSDNLSNEKIASYANKTIIIYDMMMFDGELFKYAKKLKEYGVKDLYLLSGGISKIKESIYDHQNITLKSLLDE
ncbi:rhodanese-like domain-containing protein [Pedobacter rhizosphaerae]|uniref:Rhodanese-related sulfurtransferase n=1 Tax=Pedobacter rhizosphaerae TaxID=390241 RepID=A0A1H9SW72_9SPHI|nr:rhodanese-like domain-containing protein [Pedobacter rhizosphaerae]SER88633.1 Rhodanese-related sulfurtransferase [Pedobacter rhizosphaerae]